MPANPARFTVATRVLLVVYLIAVAFIVFAPANDATKVTGIVALTAKALGPFGLDFDPTYVALEFVANIALFVPFGVLVRLAWKRASSRMVLALGLVTTVTIELTQLGLPTRYSTLSDVIANTLGTAVGLLLVRLAAGIARHRRENCASL